MKLLIIEDNKLLASSLRTYLRDMFVTDLAYTATDGLRLAQDRAHDAIVLDLVLPDGNGYEVCKTLRKSGVDVPILILTAANETATKVRLLDAGADDFLSKPFQAEELRARLHAILRRQPSTMPTSSITIKDLTIDLADRTAKRAGKPIDLRRREFDMLEYLMRNRGRVITRQMILDHVWESGSDTSSNTVDVHMKHLRDKVDRPFAGKLIETVYGFGYIMR
jgi:DNA-binding response OmpR family regulator